MNFTSKRFIFTTFMTLVYIAMLVWNPETAQHLTPFAYGLIVTYCGWETWRPSGE